MNPANTDARFGAAVAEILAAYADPEINKLLKEIDTASTGNAAIISKLISCTLMPMSTDKMNVAVTPAAAGTGFMLTKAMANPPLVSRIQTVLRDNFLPKVQSAIEHLSKIDGNEAFQFKITPKMQGDPSLKTVTVYPTEVALFNAMLHYLKFNLQTMLIYKFELADYKQADLLEALKQSNTSFFVLQTDGRQRAADAKTTFATTIAKMKLAVDYLRRISGTKADAILKTGYSSGSIKLADLDTLTTYLNKAETVINNALRVEIKNADSDGNTRTINVSLGNLLSNPPANPKQMLPAYTVSAWKTDGVKITFNASTYAELTFSDPTLGGLFPGMQQDSLKRLLHIDEDYAFCFEGYINVSPFYPSPLNGEAIVKIYTADNVYQTRADLYGNFRLLVKDASSTPKPVTKFTVIYSGQEIELANRTLYQFQGIRAKTREWASITLILPPMSLTNSLQTSPYGVRLNWAVNSYGGYFYRYDEAYRAQRKSGSGSFNDIFRNNFVTNTFSVLDDSVSLGTSYTYRIRSLTASDMPIYQNNYLSFAPKSALYSNEASITPQTVVNGTYISQGDNLAPGLKIAFKLVKIICTFNSNGNYTITQTDSSNSTTTFSGKYNCFPSTYYDYSSYSNTYGALIYHLSFNQASPVVIVSTGILAFSGNNLTFECLQTTPVIAGIPPPTVSDGFGSSTYSGIKLNAMYVNKFVKQ